jgi:outer membrane protein
MEPLSYYLKDVQQRADVQAARQRLVAATEGITVARGQHWPSIDLNANYYLERPGYLNESKWDVQLALTIPIYTGGTISSQVREAGSVRNQAELTKTLVLRQARQEIRSLYQSVTLNLEQLRALKNATTAARKNYLAQQHDYQLDLVSNLDVLQALTSYQQNQRTLDRARLTSRSDYLQLLASSVRLPLLKATP